MKLSKIITLGLSVGAMLLLSGCALKSVPEPEMIHKFEMQNPKAKADETIVYVINKTPTLFGVSVTSFLGINDQVYTQKNATYSRLVLKNKINTLSITRPDERVLSTSTEGKYPFMYKKIDNQLGNTIFFSYHIANPALYGDGNLTEIDKESGMTLVMQTTKQNDPKDIPAYGHQIALINPAFVDVKLMKKVESKSNIEAGKARVVFYRTENFDGWKSAELGIWSKSAFIGGLKGEEFLSIDIEAGHHEFATQYGAWSILDADVDAGKTYYIEVFAKWGWDAIYTKLIAKKFTTSIEEIKQQMNNFTEVTLDKSKIDTNIQLRLDAALPYVKNALENRKSVSVEYNDKLDASDGR
jgi:hypothetical protein